MSRIHYILLACFVLIAELNAQNPIPASLSANRLDGFEFRKKLQKSSLLNNIPVRAIGPTIQSCRVTDIDVNPVDPTRFYVAYASGGLWKTENNGQSFIPLFDHEAVMTIGDIAVNWNKKIIWLGSGENNSSRSSYSGNGVYKSTDEGKTWQYCGLGESHHIGRIVLHPNNPDIAWVAVLGHLYSPNPERGVFKTIDGGKTWTHCLKIDDNTGAIDLIIDPQNPDLLYTAVWHKERRAWNFVESGKSSGIYSTTNGGKTWDKISKAGSGFPETEGSGRIGLSMFSDKGKKILYAVIDNQDPKPEKDLKAEDPDIVTKKALKKMSKEDFLKLEEWQIDDFLKANDFPDKLKAKDVLKKVKDDKISLKTLVEYLEDANSLLFDTEIKGGELYTSVDNGKSWKKTHEKYLDGLFFTYGYYFSTVYAAPGNPNQIFLLGYPIVESTDGGKSFHNIGADNVHADHHALWINPKQNGHLINGNDGGINISYDYGKHWVKCNNPPVGQVYSIAVDMAKPYRVYAGFQDNGVWMGETSAKADDVDWLQSGVYPYKFIMGGDGMQTAVDTRTNNKVITGYQFGNMFSVNTITGDSKGVGPKHELGERPFRWNWQTPIQLSKHNQDILYVGAHKLFRSMDQGATFEAISDDLTAGGKVGDVPYGT
ncbi:MAG: WD40/YVTN/BNR-like repeat-containing protein, partial [Saprospiraceae bacterium]